MEDIDKLQGNIENLNRLLTALLPFVSGSMQSKLRTMTRSLEPLKHLKEMMQMVEMMQTLQSVMNKSPDGTTDFSALSGFLSPEQMQMFEMFRTMQDMQDI